MDGGVVVISRYPIVEHSRLVFRTKGIEPDALTVLQAIHILVEVTDNRTRSPSIDPSSSNPPELSSTSYSPDNSGISKPRFHFFATHLQSSYDNIPDNSRHDLARSAQALELR